MWIELTPDVVKASAGLTAPELVAASTLVLSPGVTDTLADVCGRVAREVRGYVAGCRANQLAEGDTMIPDEVLSAALARVVYELALRIPGKALLNENRVKANDNAMRALRDAADCRLAIVQPATVTTEIISAPTPRITPRHHHFDHHDQAGL